MNLPDYLQPHGGGWHIDDAVTLWGKARYGITPTDPDTSEVKRLRIRARQDVAAIASEPPDHHHKPPTIRRVHRDWLPSSYHDTPGRVLRFPPPRTWVTVASLADLFRRHGYPLPWEQADPPDELSAPERLLGDPSLMPARKKPSRPDKWGNAVTMVEAEFEQMKATSPGIQPSEAEAIKNVVYRLVKMPNENDPSYAIKAHQVEDTRIQYIDAIKQRMKRDRRKANTT